MIFVIVNIKGVPGFKFLNAKLFFWRIDKIDVFLTKRPIKQGGGYKIVTIA